MKINLEVCQGCNCPYLCVMKPGMKFAWRSIINTTDNTYYCCNAHRDCTKFRGVPPIFLKESFEDDDVPELCEMMAEYKLREWNGDKENDDN